MCDDSAYINNFAILNLKLADRAVRHLKQAAPEKLAAILKRTGATEQELSSFPEAAGRIRTMQREDGLFEQCRGFFGLREEARHSPPDPQNTRLVKQADVMLMLFLLHDQWSRDVWRVNWDYYEPRTVHGSSLSQGVHGLIAMELGLEEKAAAYTRKSLGMDLNDEMNNAAGGAHMAANGMNWLILVQGYGGSRPQGRAVRHRAAFAGRLVAAEFPAQMARGGFHGGCQAREDGRSQSPFRAGGAAAADGRQGDYGGGGRAH